MRKLLISVAIATLVLPGAAQAKLLGILKDKVKASIIDSRGLPIGAAVIARTKKRDALQVTIAVRGVSPGEHGVHLHMIGACEGPKFVSAGGHWNPTSKMHGMSNPDGSHMGDMPNMLVGKKGVGRLKFEIAGGRLSGDSGLMDKDGAAIVIHALSDDQRTDPSGNSGDRVACGVFVGG